MSIKLALDPHPTYNGDTKIMNLFTGGVYMEEQKVISVLQENGYQAVLGQTIMGNLKPKTNFLLPNFNAVRVKVHLLNFNDQNEIIVIPFSFMGKLLPEVIYVLPFSSIDTVVFKDRMIYRNMIITLKDNPKRKKYKYQVNKKIAGYKWQGENVKRVIEKLNA